MKINIRIRNVTIPFLRKPIYSMLDGRLYVIGGDVTKGHVAPSQRIYILDIQSGVWEVLPILPQLPLNTENAFAVSGGGAITVFYDAMAITILNNKVEVSDIDLPPGMTKSNTCFVENVGIVVVMADQSFIIDYANDIIGMPPPMLPTVGHAVCNIGGIVYKLGGMNMNSVPLSEVELYNTRTNEWIMGDSDTDEEIHLGNLVTEIYNHEAYMFMGDSIVAVGGVVRDLSTPQLPMLYDTFTGTSEVFTGLLYNQLDGYDEVSGPWSVIESNIGYSLITYR